MNDLNLRGLGLAAGIALTVGVAFYGVSKLAGGYVSFLAPVAPWIEANAANAWAWVQGNVTLTLGAITATIAGIKGFFTLLGTVRKQGSDLKETVEEEVGSTRTMFQNEFASFKEESDEALGGLRSELDSTKQSIGETTTQLTSFQADTSQELKGLQGMAEGQAAELKAQSDEITTLKQELEALRNAFNQKKDGLAGY